MSLSGGFRWVRLTDPLLVVGARIEGFEGMTGVITEIDDQWVVVERDDIGPSTRVTIRQRRFPNDEVKLLSLP